MEFMFHMLDYDETYIIIQSTGQTLVWLLYISYSPALHDIYFSVSTGL